MIVVADTGPLNHLVLIAQSDLLTTLFGGVSIPIAVRDELADPMAPAAVQTWIATPPYLAVHRPDSRRSRCRAGAP